MTNATTSSDTSSRWNRYPDIPNIHTEQPQSELTSTGNAKASQSARSRTEETTTTRRVLTQNPVLEPSALIQRPLGRSQRTASKKLCQRGAIPAADDDAEDSSSGSETMDEINNEEDADAIYSKHDNFQSG